MADRNRTNPSRRSAGAIRLTALAAVFAIAACTQVKETANEASDQINQWLGTDSKAAPAAATGAARHHKDGLAARRQGNEELAFARLLEAANAGHGPAAYEVGIAYKEGRGTARNLEASARWIDAAAKRGEPRAQLLLGTAYYGGISTLR